MKYPIFQISDEPWEKSHEFDVQYSDKITIISNDRLKEYFISSEYIDCNGEIYKVTDFQTTGIFSKIFRFFPLIPFSGKLIFQKLYRKLTLEEFRSLVLKRTNEVSDYNELRQIILNAKTYSEVMGDKVEF
jgi:hypothetical protein